MSETQPSLIWARAPIVLAGLAIVSGLLTYFTFNHYPHWLESDLFFGAIPYFITGMFFAAVIAFAVQRFGAANAGGTVLAFLITIVAWRLAYGATSSIYDDLSRGVDSWIKTNTLEIAGLVGGAIGSAITAIGVAIVVQGFRRLASFSLTIAIGTIAGLLLGVEDRLGWSTGNLLVFIIWQPAVAAAIGHGLARPAWASAAVKT